MDRRKDLIEYIKEYREIREQNIKTFMTENITEIIPLFQEKLRWIENGELEEVIKINDWLIGHKKPSKQGGRTVKAANLPNIFTDWYAYENQSDLGHYVKIEFPSLKAKLGSYGELLDENKTIGLLLVQEYTTPNTLIMEI